MADANQMKTIGDLLTRDLSRKIEEIIQVDQKDEHSVHAEITEYIATDSIREQYHDLLKAVAEAPSEPHESVGVWVSGFFGSGKSSFAKNLGYALENRTVLGSKFADLFKQQLTDPKKNDTRISDLLDLINARTPTGVILFEVAKGRNTRFPKAQRKNMTAADMLLWGKDTLRSISSDAIWNKPLEWNRKAERTGVRNKVFCGSMCDVMERRADLDAPRQRLFHVIEATPHLDWMLLTKRPQEYKHVLPKTWLENPRPTVWLMTTAENQQYINQRIPELLKVPAVVYGVSIEPMLGDVVLPHEFLKLKRRGWIIAGGESGNSKMLRPTPIEWFRSLRDQCIAANVAFFFKQWGSHLNLIKIGKEAAGRLLDEREWNEYPGPATVEYVDRREEILHNAASSDPIK